jgi:hypothetical protein
MRTEEMKTNNSQASTFPSNSFTRPPRISINNFWGEINKRANDVLRDVGGTLLYQRVLQFQKFHTVSKHSLNANLFKPICYKGSLSRFAKKQ